jgi:hypothetical protein
VAKTTFDQVLAALDAVKILQETVIKHDQAIGKIIDKLEQIEKRLDGMAQAKES